MGESVVLSIPRKPPPTMNRIQSMHWSKRRKLKELWQQEVAVAAIQAGRPRFKRARVQIVLYYSAARRRDSDNILAAAGKFLLDGLRYSDVIPDDDQTTIELPEPIVEIDRKNPRVELEITELEEVVS
jgi:Holliday junction resolvase RusA-like endonuclease